jgi:hypothetical protein
MRERERTSLGLLGVGNDGHVSLRYMCSVMKSCNDYILQVHTQVYRTGFVPNTVFNRV